MFVRRPLTMLFGTSSGLYTRAKLTETISFHPASLLWYKKPPTGSYAYHRFHF